MSAESKPYTTCEFLELARISDQQAEDMGQISDALSDAAKQATRLQSLEAENARLKETLVYILNDCETIQHVRYSARNALKED